MELLKNQGIKVLRSGASWHGGSHVWSLPHSQPTATEWLAAVRLALRGVSTGGELVMSSTAERTVIDLRSPDGVICTATIRRRAAPVVEARQIALPLDVAPAIEPPAPLPSALVELVAITSWEPTPPVEAIDDGRAVLWTPLTDEGPWRTVVPSAVADTLQAFAPGCFERRSPTAPSHLLRVGSLVMTPGGERAVLGLVASDDEGSSCGAVLDIAGQPQVAWLDGAAIRDGRVMLYPTDRYRGEPGDDGWWVWVAKHRQVIATAPTLVRLWLPGDAWSRLEEGGREDYELPDVDCDVTWETRGAHLTAEMPEQAARIIETMAREDELPCHRGPQPPAVGEALQRAMDAAPKKPAPSKKSAPGSKKKPHRLTPVPEADALAQQGALVAVALQPDGHWRLWASNPEKPGSALMTSPVWKKRWDGARRADLRVRLYNRARRCTHDSLDGDIGEGES